MVFGISETIPAILLLTLLGKCIEYSLGCVALVASAIFEASTIRLTFRPVGQDQVPILAGPVALQKQVGHCETQIVRTTII